MLVQQCGASHRSECPRTEQHTPAGAVAWNDPPPQPLRLTPTSRLQPTRVWPGNRLDCARGDAIHLATVLKGPDEVPSE